MTAKVLTFDIETAPMEAFVWGLNEQHVNIGQVKKDRSVLSWAAKWLDKDRVLYQGTGDQRNVRDDKKIMKGLHKLLGEADVVITQNGKRFDVPIVTGRFLVHDLGPVKPFKHIDTCQLATKMGFPTKKLEYLTKVLCPDLEKSKHNSFPGLDLWKACLGEMGAKVQRKAWKEMEAYNKQDVLGTEAVYRKLAPFGVAIDFSVYSEAFTRICSCGETNWKKEGFNKTKAGKFQQYSCRVCGSWVTDSGAANNLFSKEKKASLKGKV